MIGNTGLAGVSGSTGSGVGAAGFGTSATGGFAIGVRDCCVVLHETKQSSAAALSAQSAKSVDSIVSFPTSRHP